MAGDQNEDGYRGGDLDYRADVPPQRDSGLLYSCSALRYLPGMAETKKPSGLRFTPSIMERMAGWAPKFGRSRNDLIEWILWAFDSDPIIRERVKLFEMPEEKPKARRPRAPKTD